MYMQTEQTLIRRRVLRRLICVCTGCQLPFSGFPDYNRLTDFKIQNTSHPTDRPNKHHENIPI